MNQTKNRIVYLDLLRILATLSVIVLHVAGSKWSAVSLASYEWQVFNIADGMVRWAVPVFLMISGALFLDQDRPISAKGLFRKNILRIITAYLFWSAFYAIDSYIDGATLKGAILAFIQGHYHMWFLLMIILLYALVPLLRAITASRKTTEYFLILSITVSFIIPGTLRLLGYLHLPHTTDLLAAVKNAFVTMRSALGFGYLPYFVLGHYFAKYEIGVRPRRVGYLLGLLGLVATIVLTDWYSNVQGKAYMGFYDPFALNVLLMAAGLFLFFKYEVGKRPLKERTLKIVAKLSDYSFGAYLIHAFAIKTFSHTAGITTLTFDPILSILLISGAGALVSYGISALLHLIPGLKKYIV